MSVLAETMVRIRMEASGLRTQAEREGSQAGRGFSEAFQRAASKSGGAFKTVTRDTAEARREIRGLEHDVGKASRGAAEGAGAFKSLGRSVGIASVAFLGTEGLVEGLKKSIELGADLQKQQERTTFLFGKSSKEVQDFAEGAAKSLGLGSEHAEKMANTLGNMLVPLGLGKKHSAELSIELTKLAGNIASIRNEDPEAVLGKFLAGLRGRGASLKAYGFDISDARLKEEALRLGMVKATVDSGKLELAQRKLSEAEANAIDVKKHHLANSVAVSSADDAVTAAQAKLDKAVTGSVGPLTAQQKALVATHALLQQGGRYMGQFAAHSGDLANQQKILSAEFQNLQEHLGQELLPIATRVLTKITDWLGQSKNMEAVQRTLSTAVHTTAGVIGDLVHVVERGAPVVQKIVDVMGGWKSVLLFLIGLKVAKWAQEVVSLGMAPLERSFQRISGEGKAAAGGISAVGGAATRTGSQAAAASVEIDTFNASVNATKWAAEKALGSAPAGGGGLGARIGSGVGGLLGGLRSLSSIGKVAIPIAIATSVTNSGGSLLSNTLQDAILGFAFGGPVGAVAAGSVPIVRQIILEVSDAGGPGDTVPGSGVTGPKQVVYRNGVWVDPRTGQPLPTKGGPAGLPTQSIAEQAWENSRLAGASRLPRQGSVAQISATTLLPSAASARGLDAGRKKLLDFAKAALGTPYAWGGAGPGGFDCSGLVQWAFANGLNVQLPHFTGDQFKQTTPVSRAQALPGDLVFTGFGQAEHGRQLGAGVPGHVGIYAGNGQVLVAPHTGDVVKLQSLAKFTGQGGVRFGRVDALGGGSVAPMAAAGRAGAGGGSARDQYAEMVAAQTGLDARVVKAWMAGEGHPGDLPGYYNYMNIQSATAKWLGVPIAGTGPASTAKFGNLQRGVEAAVKEIGKLHLAGLAGQTPRQQIAAIAASPWASSHYGGPGGPNLVNAFAGMFGADALGIASSGAGLIVDHPKKPPKPPKFFSASGLRSFAKPVKDAVHDAFQSFKGATQAAIDQEKKDKANQLHASLVQQVMNQMFGDDPGTVEFAGMVGHADKLSAKYKRLTKQQLSTLKRQNDTLIKEANREVSKTKPDLDLLGDLPSALSVDVKDKLGRVTGTQTIGQMREALGKLYDQFAKTKNPQAKKKLADEIAAEIEQIFGDAASSVQAKQSEFSTAFGRVADGILTAFDRETQKHLQSMQDDVDAQIQSMQDDLTAAVKAAQRQGALLTPAESELKGLQDAHDATQAAKDLADANQQLADAKAGGDPQAIKDAQAALDEVLYNQHIAQLQKRAEAERKQRDENTDDEITALQKAEAEKEKLLQKELAAREQSYQDERDNQRTALSDQLADWQTRLLNQTATMNDFVNWLAGQKTSGALVGIDSFPDPVAAMGAAGEKQGDAFAQGWIAKLNDAITKYTEFANLVKDGPAPDATGSGINSGAAAAAAAAASLGVDPSTIPGLPHGGVVTQSGLAVVHRGEEFSGLPGAGGSSYQQTLQLLDRIARAVEGGANIDVHVQAEGANAAATAARR